MKTHRSPIFFKTEYVKAQAMHIQTLSHIYGKAFCKNSQRVTAVNNFCIKLHHTCLTGS